MSGVIQGSELGPLLFLLYINNVTDIFSSTCASKLYADDIKLYSVLDNPLDYSDLQSNLNELKQWSDRWLVNISYKKCNVLCLSNQKKRPQIDLVLGDSMISQVDSVSRQIVTNFRRKSFNVLLFPCLLENSFSSLLTKMFTFSWIFIENLSSNPM